MSEAPDCKACNGIGQFVRMTATRRYEPLPPYVPCPVCNGTGKEPAVKPLPMPPEE